MVYGYTRVSTLEQCEGASLEEQRRKILGLAMMSGYTVAHVYVDKGVSGSKQLAERPEGAKLLTTLSQGDVLIVSKLDRLFRNALDALAMAEHFMRTGVDLIIADIGVDPVTQNGTSKMFFGMLALMAEFERERIRERVAEGKAAKQNAGGFVGGRRPFGFTVEGEGRNAVLVPDAAEQRATARIRALRAEGKSYRAIAAELGADGFVISHTAVKNILEREE
jgi:putative DNA-invertase from lambdoid prophage Rac